MNFIVKCFYYLFFICFKLKNKCLEICYPKRNDFEIINIKLYNGKEILKLSNSKNIKTIINKKWEYIKTLDLNFNMIDIQYFYDKKTYNIIYKYPFDIIFPIKLEPFNNKILYLDDDILEGIILKYAGPTKDFYNNNNQNIMLKDIFIMNEIEEEKEIVYTNNLLSEKTLKMNEIIKLN